MLIYPFNSPIILNNDRFVEYGGLAGNFSDAILNSSYWLAEMQVTAYIGTPLLPVVVTGTYHAHAQNNRIATDYGYVHRLLNVNVQSREDSLNCDLKDNSACAYIFNDTFGYVDWKMTSVACGCTSNYIQPYQVQIAYEAGLPTGTATQPTILEALTILAQIDLNEKSPGTVGMNEGVGDIGIQSFSSLDYSERRGEHSLVKTVLGESAKAMRAKRLIDLTVQKARRALFL